MLLKDKLDNRTIGSIEKVLFYLLLLVNLIPLFTSKYFLTVDGPAHLHNAHLLIELLRGNSFLRDYYQINPNPVPNWTATLLSAGLLEIFPAYICEKMIIGSYVLGLPLMFRWIVKKQQPQTTFATLLIFPFTFSLPLFMGFYNFNIAILIMLLIIGFWIRKCDSFNFKKAISIGLLGVILYFSHVFVFIVLIITINLFILFDFVVKKENQKKPDLQEILKRFLLFNLINIPGYLLTLLFFNSQTNNQTHHISTWDLILQLRSIRSLIVFNYIDLEIHLKIMFYTLMLLTVIILLVRLLAFRKDSLKYPIIHATDKWLVVCLILFVMYLVLPTEGSSAGFISERFNYLIFICFIVWLSSQRINYKISIPFASIFIIINTIFMLYYNEKIQQYSKTAIQMETVEPELDNNQVVLPITQSDDWYIQHISNYLGIRKNVIILENYECGTGYFPIVWNKKSMPNIKLASLDNNSLGIDWIANKQNKEKKIDKVILIGTSPSLTSEKQLLLKNTLIQYYSTPKTIDNITVYSLK